MRRLDDEVIVELDGVPGLVGGHHDFVDLLSGTDSDHFDLGFRSDRPRYVVADMARLPFADASFDCVTCGYVLEHLPDPRLGLAELSRVMMPGARMLLLTTEDNVAGAWTSRVWCCRTYNRRELLSTCTRLGLHWAKELWFSPLHKVFRAGGICVEIVKRG